MPEMLKIEKRFFVEKDKFEVREKQNGKKEIEGYAMKWETLSDEIGFCYKFREKFTKGSFRDYLSDNSNDVKALIHHDMSRVLARKKYSTLEVYEDDIGLKYLVELANNTLGNDVYESVTRGDIDGISVGFLMRVEEWNESDDENVIRTIKKAELPEFSFTSFPAYPSTTTDVRSLEEPYRNYLESFTNNRSVMLKKLKRFGYIQRFK